MRLRSGLHTPRISAGSIRKRPRRERKGIAKMNWDDLLLQRHHRLGESLPIVSSPSRPMDFIYRNCVQCGEQRFGEDQWQVIKEYGARAGEDLLFCSTGCMRDFLGHDVWARETATYLGFIAEENWLSRK